MQKVNAHTGNVSAMIMFANDRTRVVSGQKGTINSHELTK